MAFNHLLRYTYRYRRGCSEKKPGDRRAWTVGGGRKGKKQGKQGEKGVFGFLQGLMDITVF
jgi:hypothetical protein